MKYQKRETENKVTIKYTYKLDDKPKIKMTNELSLIIKTHFDDNIKNIKTTILKELIKTKEITKEQEQTLIKLKKAFIKGILDDVVDYSEVVKEEQDESDADADAAEQEQGDAQEQPVEDIPNLEVEPDLDETSYSPDSPRHDDRGNLYPMMIPIDRVNINLDSKRVSF